MNFMTKFNRLIIQANPWSVMTKSAVHTFPDECCGFIFGLQGNLKDDVKIALEVNNAEALDKNRYFKISSYDYLKAEHYAEQNNLALLGIYHSHPNHPALPSPDDTQFALPNISYLIISVYGQIVSEIKCWRLDENKMFTEQVVETLL